MKYDVKVTSVSLEPMEVTGTCGGKPFKAAPFFWGNKSLLKVVPEFYSSFEQGEKVAIGQAAKAAIRAAGGTIPDAPPSTRSRKETAPPVPDARYRDLEARLARAEALLAAVAPAAEVLPEPEVEAEVPAPEPEVEATTPRGRRK